MSGAARPLRLALLVLLAAAGLRADVAADRAALAARLADAKQRTTWVITGDSITHGAKWLGRERSYPEIIQERLRWELRRVRDAVINTGVSGETSAGLLADFDWRVRRFQPDVVSVMIGMNDAARPPEFRAGFADRLRDLVRRIREAGAIPLLHRTNPIDETSGDQSVTSRTPLPEINAVIAAVGAEEQVIVVDHWAHWQEARKTDALNRTWLADPIHPNGTGHRQLAILTMQALGLYDPASPACQP